MFSNKARRENLETRMAQCDLTRFVGHLQLNFDFKLKRKFVTLCQTSTVKIQFELVI